MLYPSPSSTVENVYCGGCVSWHGVTAFDSSAWTQPDANTTFIRWIFTQTQTHSRCSWYRPFLGVPVNMTLGIWPHSYYQILQLFQEGWKWGCCPMNEKVSGWWIESPCREELTDLWFKQTGNGKPIELMSYHWLFLVYLNLAPPPLNKGSQHTSSLCQVG